ncbi:MAG: protein kinase [Actinomycetaceae bacterium]|nr:protein kinase [Actinomycetaceae bacterium]
MPPKLSTGIRVTKLSTDRLRVVLHVGLMWWACAMVIEGYELHEALSHGSGTTMWRATTANGDTVAVQVITSPQDPQWHAKADALLGFTHPALRDLRDIHMISAGRMVLVWEYLVGESLDIVMSCTRFSPGQVTSLGIHVAQGLAHLHNYGLAHADISPSNIFMSEGGHAILLDTLGWPGEQGTPGFSAPERSLTGPSAAGDVYSLAKVLQELGLEPQYLQSALGNDPETRCSAVELEKILTEAHLTESLGVPAQLDLIGAQIRAEVKYEATTVEDKKKRGRHRENRGRKTFRILKPALLGICAVGLVVGMAGLATSMFDEENTQATTYASTLGDETAIAAEDSKVGEGLDMKPLGDPGAVLREVARLLAIRDRALMEGDAPALAKINKAGSAIAESDMALLASIASVGVQIRGLTTQVSDVAIVEAKTTTTRLEATITQGAYEKIDKQGGMSRVNALAPRCVEILLEACEAGNWQISQVEPATDSVGACNQTRRVLADPSQS